MQRLINGLFAKNPPQATPKLSAAFLATDIKAVLQELLNTYLSVRITEGLHGWTNIDVSNPPATGVQHDKLAIVAELGGKIPFFGRAFELDPEDVRNIKDFVANLLELESHERGVKDATSSPFGTKLASIVIKQDSLLERTMHAMRSFILEEFKRYDPDEFERFRRKFAALVEVESRGYHHEFFKEVIMGRDQGIGNDGKPQFEEKSFSDYCNSVIIGNRHSQLLNKLLIAMPTPTVQSHSTFSETIDTSLEVESNSLRRY
jgi:hypothetical protein